MATSTFTQLLSSDILPYDYLSPLRDSSVETWLHYAQTTKLVTLPSVLPLLHLPLPLGVVQSLVLMTLLLSCVSWLFPCHQPSLSERWMWDL